MDPKLHELYSAPFHHECGYIGDANGEMTADFHGVGDSFRARGWGRFKYMDGGEQLHDQMEALLNAIVKGYEKEPEKCVELLNAAWSAVC